jgi:hypothetical protein
METAVISPAATKSSIEEDWSDSPSPSLILQAPVYEVVGDELCVQARTWPATNRSPTETRKCSLLSSSLLQTLVHLFAGRKNVQKPGKSRQPHESSSSSANAVTSVNQDKVWEIQRASSGRAATPAPLSSPPKLTHRQAILFIQRASAENLLQRSGYRDISPAPEHRKTGYAVTAKDTFMPLSIQRGFDAPSLSPSLASPLEHRRNHSAGNLLDRNGDAWARWHTKYPNMESNPSSYG